MYHILIGPELEAMNDAAKEAGITVMFAIFIAKSNTHNALRFNFKLFDLYKFVFA